MDPEEANLRTARRFLKHVSFVNKGFKPKILVKPTLVSAQIPGSIQTVVTTVTTNKKARKGSRKRRCMTQDELRKECNIETIEETLNLLVEQNAELKDYLVKNMKSLSKIETRVDKLEQKSIGKAPVKKVSKTSTKSKVVEVPKFKTKILSKIKSRKPIQKKAQSVTTTQTVVKTTITKEEKPVVQPVPVTEDNEKRIAHLEAQYENLKNMNYDPFYLAKIRERIENLKKNI